MDAARSSDRLDYVDALRGFALFGVFGANLFIFSGLVYMNDAARNALPTAAIDQVVQFLELIFVENKFMGLFAILFGVSFWLFLSGKRARGDDGTLLFYRRIFWLFVIGALHGWLFWCWDILRFYALWALLLPLFLLVSTRVLLVCALACAVVLPAIITGLRVSGWPDPPGGEALDALALQTFATGSYPNVLRINWLYDWYLTLAVSQIAYQVAVLGRLLVGLFIARMGFFMDLAKYRAMLVRLLVWGGLFGVTANVLDASGTLHVPDGSGFLWPFISRLTRETGYLSLSLAYAAALALLFQTPWRRYIEFLKPLGRMALTFYLGQTVLGLWLFYGFMPGPDWMGKVGAAWLVPIWFGGYALQVWLASAWLRRFRFGPAEWLWRCLTYWRMQPFRLAHAS